MAREAMGTVAGFRVILLYRQVRRLRIADVHSALSTLIFHKRCLHRTMNVSCATRPSVWRLTKASHGKSSV